MERITHSVFLTKSFHATSTSILKLFADNTVFRLTGANDIEGVFKLNTQFRLTFNDRGVIYGRFLKITEKELQLEWNVEGFQRPSETKTILEIHLEQQEENCILALKHSNIINEESAIEKKRAWQEILDNLGKILEHI